MLITKKHLPRRTFLRGMAGTAIALPLLEAMLPALTPQSATAAAPRLRFGAIYSPNGMSPGQWEPDTLGTGFEFKRIMKPLEPFRNQLTVISGLNQDDLGIVHMTASAMWLNGTPPKKTEGADIGAGVSIDQLIAERIGAGTLLPSMELATETVNPGACYPNYSCLYFNTMTWRTATQPLLPEINPRGVFQRMFSETGTRPERTAKMESKRSILDAAVGEIQSLERRLGAADRVRLNQYVEDIRDVESRIQRAEQMLDIAADLPPLPSGIPDTFQEHVQLLFDLQLIALQSDITRVFTFLLCREATDRAYPWLGVPDSFHSMSHHAGRPKFLEDYAVVNTYHTQLVADWVKKLQATPDGDGSLLDHSLLLYGSGISDGNKHSRASLPLVLLGGANGRLKGGRHIGHRTPAPLSNLLLSIGELAGLSIEQFGTSTGRVAL